MVRLLLVDDEPVMLIATKTFLEKDHADIECDTCSSAREALEKLATSSYDAIVADYDMPEMDGIALLKAVRTQYSDFPFILLTGRGREEMVIEALNEGLDFYLQTSDEPRVLSAELASKIRHAIDRRRVREALKRTQFSIDHLSAEFYWIDHEGCLIDVNEYACRKLGYTRDELFAMRVPDVDPDFDIEGFEVAWQEAWQDLKGHKTLRLESHHRKRDGTVYPVELSLNYCQMGEKEFMCAFATDITERKQAEEALRRSESRYRTLVENIHDVVYSYSLEGQITYVSPNVQTCFGYTPSEMIGHSLFEYVHPEDREAVRRDYQRTITTSEEFTTYCRLIQKDGSVIHIEEIARKVVDGAGNIVGYSGVIRDITERKQAEEALQESKERYRAVVENSLDAVYRRNLQTDRYDYMSPVIEQITGFTPDEMNTMSIDEILDRIHPDDRRSVDAELARSIASGRGIIEYRFRTRDDRYRWLADHFTVLRDRSGRPLFRGGVVRDVTDRKHAEEVLKDASKKLNLLTSITRHDILNQVTALKGFLVLLEEQQHDEGEAKEMFRHLEKIADTIRRQITFTGDYQDMGERDPEWQQVEWVVKRAAASVRRNGVAITVTTGSLELFADPMLEKAFYNLLDNAVIHGKRVEHIWVSFHADGDAGVLVFEDDGVGVPASSKDKIFKRGFGKITGYGLFLVKEILDITGLSIRETGEEGKGARFEIEVPAGKWRM